VAFKIVHALLTGGIMSVTTVSSFCHHERSQWWFYARLVIYDLSTTVGCYTWKML